MNANPFPSLRDYLDQQASMTGGPQPRFDPMGGGYDYQTALQHGMGPTGRGKNLGHWGSVAPATMEHRGQHGLPMEAYIMLKGRDHHTWDKGVAGEEARGFKVIQLGDRFFSVPNWWTPPGTK